jgi:2-methylisocitrate lyase-like PEP mutase family enzyme
MPSQSEKLIHFAELHVPGDPLILFNIWDAGSAVAVTKAGAKAIATGSFSVAGAHGFSDGEDMPFALVIGNAARIVAATTLPVSLDLESGYGDSPADVHTAALQVADTGVVGINLEDQHIGGNGLYSIQEQCLRISAASKAGLFVNARTDIFILASAESHNAALVDQALERAHAYANAGAKGFFVPMLSDPDLIGVLCANSPLPVNIMLRSGCPTPAELAKLGVARISHGPGPWRSAMATLEAQARQALVLNKKDR